MKNNRLTPGSKSCSLERFQREVDRAVRILLAGPPAINEEVVFGRLWKILDLSPVYRVLTRRDIVRRWGQKIVALVASHPEHLRQSADQLLSQWILIHRECLGTRRFRKSCGTALDRFYTSLESEHLTGRRLLKFRQRLEIKYAGRVHQILQSAREAQSRELTSSAVNGRIELIIGDARVSLSSANARDELRDYVESHRSPLSGGQYFPLLCITCTSVYGISFL